MKPLIGVNVEREYKVVKGSEAIDGKFPYCNSFSEDCWVLYAYDDGKPVIFIGCDGGEPEDQLLVRNWKWVASSLEQAYHAGYLQCVIDSVPDTVT